MRNSNRGNAWSVLCAAILICRAGFCADAVAPVATRTEVPRLPAAADYQMADNTFAIELSEYAGYSGLIAINGGLEPNENSPFTKKHGFKLKISLSEQESWPALNTGKLGASATTVDVLAVYGRQFQVVVPAQIGFSRGADGVVVRSDIKRINALKGKILATSQFTEADFFIRYLAQEAGLAVNMLPDLKTAPDPAKVNLIYADDAFAAADLFLDDVKSGKNILAGCVTWAPKTTEVVQASGAKAQILTTNRNLLVVADILLVNRGFANASPDKVAALVAGLIEGNQMVRENPEANIDTIAKAFKWDKEKARAELAKVHLSNLPENLAFFSGALDAAGSFGGIFLSAIYSYGKELIKTSSDGEYFVDLKHLKALDQTGAFKNQKIAIAPIRSAGGANVEGDPLLSKDIRFFFEPNSYSLDLKNDENIKNLDAIRRLLQVSPGSTVLLRGHVDNSLVPQFMKKGGQAFVREMALKAMELSKNRAGEIKRLLVEKQNVDDKRLSAIGVGWDEPASDKEPELNRRVEVQWFTLE